MIICNISQLNKKDCTGCGSCWNICPQNCIEYDFDNDGFLYPNVNSACIHCGLCSKACPILTEKTQQIPDVEQFAVAAISRDSSVCKLSTSGGAFTEICKAYGDSDTVIFGAAFIGLKVNHLYVIGVDNIAPFRKSKYVQSSVDKCHSDAKKYLDQGRKVIFAGTPCQIAGLRSFLRKDYANLLCIDFICHGAGSPGVFEKAMLSIQNDYDKKLKNYSFRNFINKLGNCVDYVCKYEFEDGSQVYNSNDLYQNLFLAQLCLRESCGENCKFRNVNRLSDITMADFKGKFQIYPNMIDYRNYSTIIINSKKGEAIFPKLKKAMKVLKCDLSDIEKYNPLFFRTTNSNPNRNNFFEMYRNGVSLKDLARMFVISNQIEYQSFIIRNFVPFYFKRIYRIIINKLKTINKTISFKPNY